MPRKKQEIINADWEAEIAAYDAEQKSHDREYYEHNIIITGGNTSDLTDEENLVLNLFLAGTSCEEIARQNSVDIDIVTGLLEIIRAKLSLND